MAELTKNQLLSRLNLWLDDTTNTTYTAEIKGEFLNTAINDPYVYKVSYDSSLTSISNQPSYLLPDGIEEVYDIFLDINDNGFGDHLDRGGWDIIDGSIYFTNQYWGLPGGHGLILYAKQKLTSSDSIPDLTQEYILHLAMIEALQWLKNKLSTRFLKNDMTMSDLINSMSTHQRRAAELRRRIANQRVVTV